MKKRKTIGVQVMVDYANRQLARVDEVATDEYKAGVCDMIERLLFESGNYDGYYFLDFENRGNYARKYFCRIK